GQWVKPAPEGPTATSLIEFASKSRPLIIFDSLVAFHPGSEQDASETRKHMQSYISLAATGAAVVILHHRQGGDGQAISWQFRYQSGGRRGLRLGAGGRSRPGNWSFTPEAVQKPAEPAGNVVLRLPGRPI